MSIKLVTVQHKDVLQSLLNGDIYYANMERVPANLKIPYKKIMSAYQWKTCPVFTGVVGKLAEFYGASMVETFLLELVVPDNEVRFQNYYDWSDLIYYTECSSEWDGKISLEEFEEHVLHKNAFKENEVIQATINRIEPSWLKEQKSVSQKFEKSHFGTGGRNILKPISEY